MTSPADLHPQDEHNEKLVDHVHPPDWVNPDPAPRYNLVAIGGGAAGLISAMGTAGLGGKAAIVERHWLGGDCLNYGCVPSKALIRAAHAAADVRRAHEYGVIVPDGVRVDFPVVMERMRRLRAQIAPNDSADRLRGMGVDVYFGQAKFSGPETIDVDGKTLRFRRAVIATGARGAVLPIPGLADAGYLTNENIFSLTELPTRLAVIGSGPIGCELAQSFARFGSQVTLLEAKGQILTREDPDAAVIVQRAMVKDGVALRFNADILRVEKRGNEKAIVYQQEGQEHEACVDEILVGVGRTPNVGGLGLDVAGVRYDERRGVEVDDYLQTSNHRVYAAGDICLNFKFTHTADATARIVVRNALMPGPKTRVSTLTVPWCTYTDPEIAHVGMYAKDAEERSIATDTFVQELGDVDRAILEGEDEGFVKVHAVKGKGEILGATIVARHAGEMISEITALMVGKQGLGTLANTIHPYPTQAEAIKRVGDAYMRSRLTPTVAAIFRTWMKWTR